MTDWQDGDRTVESILGAYLFPEDEEPPKATSATTGKDSNDGTGQPAGAADPAPPPSAGGGGGQAQPVQAHAPPKRVPKWDGPEYLARPSPETIEVPFPDKVDKPQDRTPQELTKEEADALLIPDTFKANAAFRVAFGYKIPWCKRLEPTEDKTKDLVAIIKEVRDRIAKVPVVGLNASDPAANAVTSSSIDGNYGKRIELTFWNGFQLQFNVTYGGVAHDVSKKAQWTSDDPTIASVDATGKIATKKKEGTTNVKATWKSVSQTVEVNVSTKNAAHASKSTIANRGNAAKLGALNWTAYQPPKLVGWVFDEEQSTMGPSYYFQFDKFVEAMSKNVGEAWKVWTILRKISQEGSSASINTYDGMVLTLGSGNAAAGAFNVLAEASARSKEVRKFLYLCGLKVEWMPAAQTPERIPHAISFVDLSDESKPRILYFDNVFHFYGYAVGRIPGSKVAEPVRPFEAPATAPTMPDGMSKYDVNEKKYLVTNVGGPHPFTAFRHLTPLTKPPSDEYGLKKNNIELLHAIISLRSSFTPATGKVFFDIDWEKSVGHVDHGIPASAASGGKDVAIGLLSVFVYCGMIAHNWGFGSQVANGIKAAKDKTGLPGFVQRYLSDDEQRIVKSGAADDHNRNALIAKACARGVAVLLERFRIATAIERFKRNPKGGPILYEPLERMKGAGWWGYGRVINYWREMYTGLPLKGEKVRTRLENWKKFATAPRDAQSLFDHYKVDANDYVKLVAAEGLLKLKDADGVWSDGFSIVPKTDGKFDATKFYAKDYTDGSNTGNASGSYGGDGSAYFCVGPTARLTDLPAIVRRFARGFQIEGVITPEANKIFVVWRVTTPTDANVGKIVLTNALGEFVDDKRAAQAGPVFFDANPWEKK